MVKRILAEVPLPPVIQRRFLLYHRISDTAESRMTMMRLHSEGRNKRSIAGNLEFSRQTVRTRLRR